MAPRVLAKVAVTLVLVCAVLRTPVHAQPGGGCACLKKQVVGNCRGICACLLAQGQAVGSLAICEGVCNPCAADLKKPCPSDDRLPPSCARPASYGAAVQKCSAVANKQCDPPARVQAERAPAGRRALLQVPF